MDDLLSIALEAHSDELNRHRRYEIAVGRDLLEHWTVTIRYGRVGGPLREARFGSPDAGDARTIVQDRLKRRVSAPRRIGCAYRVAAFSAKRECELGGWLPPALLGRLLG
jgi:hypothetical protein